MATEAQPKEDKTVEAGGSEEAFDNFYQEVLVFVLF